MAVQEGPGVSDVRLDHEADVAMLLARLDAVEERLAAHAASDTPTGLTDPDPPTGERWEAGQVWAHVTEFVPYWERQARIVLEAPAGEVAPFGRTKTDDERAAAIERDRHEPPAALMARATEGLASLRGFASGLSATEWQRPGMHPTRGEVPLRMIVSQFEVSHLEEHADQLDALAGVGSPS